MNGTVGIILGLVLVLQHAPSTSGFLPSLFRPSSISFAANTRSYKSINAMDEARRGQGEGLTPEKLAGLTETNAVKKGSMPEIINVEDVLPDMSRAEEIAQMWAEKIKHGKNACVCSLL
jgi:hypothetical protein